MTRKICFLFCAVCCGLFFCIWQNSWSAGTFVLFLLLAIDLRLPLEWLEK